MRLGTYVSIRAEGVLMRRRLELELGSDLFGRIRASGAWEKEAELFRDETDLFSIRTGGSIP